MSVKDRTVWITGASRGLGRSIAVAFGKAGANVIANGRDRKALAETESLLSAAGASYQINALDVTDEPAVTKFIASLPRLDIVINNAGIARYRPALETPTSELREILEVNVVACFVILREATRKMLTQPAGGHVISIASDLAVSGIAQMAPYTASKHALLGMSRSFSHEFREKGIRFTTYCPGSITTDIIGPGTANPNSMPPDVLAETIVHLASMPPRVEVQEMLVRPIYGK